MRKGQIMSQEQKDKISKGRIGKYSGENNPRWKSGKWIDEDGYVMVYSPNHPNKTYGRYIREHRLIIEESIGRFLEKDEVVHHINGIRSDNRIENLVLIKNQGEHISSHNGNRHRDTKGRFLD